jgi:hypothetical protein
MNSEREMTIVELAARASEQLGPIRTDNLVHAGCYQEASRVSAARVAIDNLLRRAKHRERRGQDAERATARLQFLLRKLFTADDEYGTGFYNTDKWREAYDALRAEVGMEVKE